MKNKDYKLELIKYFIISFIFVFILFLFNFIAIKKYEYNTNVIISNIIDIVKEEYPNIDESKIIKELDDTKLDNKVLKQYGIDINDGSFNKSNRFIIITICILDILLICIFILLIYLIIKNNKKKSDYNIKELNKYLEDINKGIYDIGIDEEREDEVSILKNEIYKTGVKLNEEANTLSKERLVLKNSLSDISHQLRTPLTSIIIMMNNILENPDMDKQTKKEFLSDINHKINNMSFLIEELLKLSKFDANTIEFKNEKINVTKLLDDVKDNLSTLCDLKNIDINVKGDKNIYFMGDYKWELEALTNIVKNAIEHSYDEGNIDISFSDNDLFTRIYIKDHGVGISKKELKNIFKRFYKGKNSSSNSIGIGLNLAESIITKDNGIIRVESTENKGTTFNISYYKK